MPKIDQSRIPFDSLLKGLNTKILFLVSANVCVFLAWIFILQHAHAAPVENELITASWSLRETVLANSQWLSVANKDMAEFMGISLKTVLIGIHLLGLVFGFGAAIFLDLYLLRYIYFKAVEPHTYELAEFGGKLVTLGLMFLWISGLGFLVLYWQETPEKLGNPKVLAKVTIVFMLTLNGFALHYGPLARIKESEGRFLFDGFSQMTRVVTLLIGAVSIVSWSVAMLLGFTKEFNNVIPAEVFLGGYYLAIVTLFLAMSFITSVMPKRANPTPMSEFRPSNRRMRAALKPESIQQW